MQNHFSHSLGVRLPSPCRPSSASLSTRINIRLLHNLLIALFQQLKSNFLCRIFENEPLPNGRPPSSTIVPSRPVPHQIVSPHPVETHNQRNFFVAPQMPEPKPKPRRVPLLPSSRCHVHSPTERTRT